MAYINRVTVITDPITGITGSLGTERDPMIMHINDVSHTAFGELRTAEAEHVFDTQNNYGLDTSRWAVAITGSGHVNDVTARSVVELRVSGSANNWTRIRTNQYFKYFAGKGTRIRQTLFNSNTGSAGQVRRWGLYDDSDGVFWCVSGTDRYVGRRTSTSGTPTDVIVSSSAWNYDHMDGSGPSGLTLDVTKGNIYEVRLQWLGVGAVDYYVSGHKVHTMSHANTMTSPYIRTATLPVQYEVLQTSASTDPGGIDVICSDVVTEGMSVPKMFAYGVHTDAWLGVGTTPPEVPLLSIRVARNYKGLTNRKIYVPTKMIVASETQRASYRLVWNPTLTLAAGGQWSAVDATSGIEFAASGSSFSGGTTLLWGMVGAGVDEVIDLTDIFNVNGRLMKVDAFNSGSDVLTVVVFNEATGTTNMKGSISWQEMKV